MRSLDKKIIYALIIGIISLFFIFVFNGMKRQSVPTEENYILYKDAELLASLETVTTPNERALGLSGRESLPELTGMIFVFPEKGKHGIWMKDMKFTIDILWLDEKFEVVNLKRAVTPETYPTIFTPSRDIFYAIEVQSGFAEKHEIKIGEILDIRKESADKP